MFQIAWAFVTQRRSSSSLPNPAVTVGGSVCGRVEGQLLAVVSLNLNSWKTTHTQMLLKDHSAHFESVQPTLDETTNSFVCVRTDRPGPRPRPEPRPRPGPRASHCEKFTCFTFDLLIKLFLF